MTLPARPALTREQAQVLDALRDAAVAAGEDGVVVYLNGAAEALLGWPRTELLGRPLSTLVPERLRARHRAGFERYWSTRQPRIVGRPVRLPALRRDGSEVEVDLTLTPFLLGDGGEIVIGLMRDLRERVELEAQLSTSRAAHSEVQVRLAQSEQRLRLLLESIADYAILMLDHGGLVATWSAGAERITGYQETEIVGRHFSIFYPAEEVARGKCQLELAAAEELGRVEDEAWRVRKDGSRFWANTVISAVRGAAGELIGFAKVTRDLTERRRAEQERLQLVQEQRARELAQAAAERARFLSEASALLASSLDYEVTLQGVARAVVPGFADWCSVELLERGQITTMAVAHVDPAKVALAHELRRRWPPDPEARSGSASVLRTGRAELYEEIPDELLVQRTRDAEHLRVARELHLRSSVVVPLVARAQTLGAITLIWAESGRRYTAEDVPFLEELGRRAGIAVDNARLYREAQQAIRLRDEFLSIASHELRTPLTSLQLHVGGLRRTLRSGGIERMRVESLVPRFDAVDRQVRRMARLVNDLLDVSRATAGRPALHLEPVDVAEVVSEVASRFREELARAGCDLSHRVPPGIVGQWDRMRLDQVVSNLVANAIKYGDGKPIEIVGGVQQGLARISVRDHGIGIAPEDQARIFERFGRAVSTEHYGGLGLGLWISHVFVEAMGGSIAVESRLEAGSTFTVTLPLAGPAADPVPPDPGV